MDAVFCSLRKMGLTDEQYLSASCAQAGTAEEAGEVMEGNMVLGQMRCTTQKVPASPLPAVNRKLNGLAVATTIYGCPMNAVKRRDASLL